MLLLLLKNEAPYSKGALSSLPSGVGMLANAYTSTDVTNVSTVDGVRVDITGTAYLMHQFKKTGANNTTPIHITWTGQSTLAASTYIFKLEIYNFNTTSWEVLATNSTTAANTNITLSATVSTSLSNYYNATFDVFIRIYQVVI